MQFTGHGNSVRRLPLKGQYLQKKVAYLKFGCNLFKNSITQTIQQFKPPKIEWAKYIWLVIFINKTKRVK